MRNDRLENFDRQWDIPATAIAVPLVSLTQLVAACW
jgi:hypothetical protein